jgi:hypothetical protein
MRTARYQVDENVGITVKLRSVQFNTGYRIPMKSEVGAYKRGRLVKLFLVPHGSFNNGLPRIISYPRITERAVLGCTIYEHCRLDELKSPIRFYRRRR